MAVPELPPQEVDALLREAPESAEARWSGMAEEELREEVARHRSLISALSHHMMRLGLPVRLDDVYVPDGGERGGAGPEQGTSGDGSESGVESIGEARGSAEECGPAPGAVGTEEDPSAGDASALCCLDSIDPREWQVPPQCIPIHANVTTYDWAPLAAATQFDVIMMDPAWQLATANPTRGVALGYSQLTDRDIQGLPIPSLQSSGFLLIWVINAKYQFALDLFAGWGYDLVDEIVWVKMTVNRRLAKSHGFYLQHAKEVCLVGRKGADPAGTRSAVASDVILAERRGQSQKPEEIYQLVEALVPGGRYLEIFGRKNNLRDHWVTIGNEVTGQGLPAEDLSALHQGGRIPGAVFGRGAA